MAGYGGGQAAHLCAGGAPAITVDGVRQLGSLAAAPRPATIRTATAHKTAVDT